MRRSTRRTRDPWLRSIDESVPRHRHDTRRLSTAEILVVALVIAAVIAMAVWFLFISHGGIGPGTV